MVRLTVINDTEDIVEFVSGLSNEVVLEPGESAEIEVRDGDIMYIDLVRPTIREAKE